VALPDLKQLAFYQAALQVALEMVAPIALGWFLDDYLGWTPRPWAMVVGAFLGFAGGLAHLIVLVNRKNRDDKNRDNGEPDPPP